MTAGAWAIGGGEKRLGWGAIVAGIVGGAGAVAATQSGTGNLEDVVTWSALIAATLRYATPLIFGALGGIISERSGVVNVGLEGMMLMGAFFGIFGADLLDSWFLGLLVGMAAGGVLALVHAFFSVQLRADQIVSGIALNFLALGVTGYVFLDHYGDQGTPDNIPRVPDIAPAGRQNLSFFGDAIGHANMLTWVALILVVALTVFLFRTPRGLRLRSVGEHPRAAETVGISVPRTRYFAVVASGMLAAMGGAYLSIGFVGSFNQGMTAGRGLHRAGGGHLRQVAPGRRARRGAAVRLLHRARPAAAGLLALDRCPLPGAAVRAHADRGGRRHRTVAARRQPSASPTSRSSVAVARLSVSPPAPSHIAPSNLSDEVELYQRTYSTLLRSSGETRLRVLESSHMAMGSSLHPLAESDEIDLGAFIYAVRRLPETMVRIKIVVMGQEAALFRRAGIGPLEQWDAVEAPARRRRWYDSGDEVLAVLLASESDVDDLVPTLVAYQIEWNKIRRRMLAAGWPPGEGPTPEACAAALGGAPDDWARLADAWGARFEEHMQAIADEGKSMRVRMLGGTQVGYQRMTRRWWAPVRADLNERRARRRAAVLRLLEHPLALQPGHRAGAPGRERARGLRRAAGTTRTSRRSSRAFATGARRARGRTSCTSSARDFFDAGRPGAAAQAPRGRGAGGRRAHPLEDRAARPRPGHPARPTSTRRGSTRGWAPSTPSAWPAARPSSSTPTTRSASRPTTCCARWPSTRPTCAASTSWARRPRSTPTSAT